MTQYTSLADAAQATGNPRYGAGTTEVWYYKLQDTDERTPRFASLGTYKDKETGKIIAELPDHENLEATHVKIGTIDSNEPEEIFYLMQGEVWSPRGQANDIIGKSDTGHTSMSVGDVVVVNGEAFMVDGMGFHKLG